MGTTLTSDIVQGRTVGSTGGGCELQRCRQPGPHEGKRFLLPAHVRCSMAILDKGEIDKIGEASAIGDPHGLIRRTIGIAGHVKFHLVDVHRGWCQMLWETKPGAIPAQIDAANTVSRLPIGTDVVNAATANSPVGDGGADPAARVSKTPEVGSRLRSSH